MFIYSGVGGGPQKTQLPPASWPQWCTPTNITKSSRYTYKMAYILCSKEKVDNLDMKNINPVRMNEWMNKWKNE